MRTLISLVSIAALLTGCAGSGPKDRTATNSEPSTAVTSSTDAENPYFATAEMLYGTDHVVEIVLEIDDADAAALSEETNVLFDLLYGDTCLQTPWNGPFNWYPAHITVDGERFEDVGIRKKGLIGSLSTTKPSLKVKFDKFVADQTFHGMERLTLNNSLSDPTLVKQCLGYQAFADAGLPAPRCGFAHVVANGEDLGVFVNIEPYKKDFLKVAFDGNDEGDLYEGTVSDFREGWTESFDIKTSATDVARGPIHAVAAALEIVDDGEMIAALEAVMALDDFFDYWAMETLLLHPDGYAGNANNYYVYQPVDGKLQFLPWGIDAILMGSQEGVVMANTALSQRLWTSANGQERYLRALNTLLDTVWDGEVMADEAVRMAALIEPFALPDTSRVSLQDELEVLLRGRSDALRLALTEELPDFSDPLREDICLTDAGDLRVDFVTTWGSLEVADPLAEGSSTMSGLLGTEDLAFNGGAIAGEDDGAASIAGIVLTSAISARYALVSIPMSDMAVGTFELDGFQTVGLLASIHFTVSDDAEVEASIWGGQLVITEYTGVEGSTVRGYFEGPLYYSELY